MKQRFVRKRVLGALLFVFVLVAAAEAQNEAVRLPDDSKFTSDAVFEVSKDGSEVISSGTKNGVRYRISHRNARGSVEGAKGSDLAVGTFRPGSEIWQLACHRFPKTDSKKCLIARNGIAYIISVGRSGSIPWLTTTNIQLPMSGPASVEVDDVIIYRNNVMAPDAMERLSKGKRATVRIAPDPNVPEWRVIAFDLYGFNEAVELCTWAVKEVQ